MAPSASNRACEVLEALVRDEVCAEESDCDSPQLACSQRLDLDGDGTEDLVSFTESGEQIVLQVAFGNGETRLVTEPFEITEVPDLGQPWPPPSDETYPAEVSWLIAWDVAKREGDA